MRLPACTAAVTTAALATAATAGPLNPPSGPVDSTYKTIQQVEPRTPVTPETTPGDGDSVFRIVQPGAYYLTDDVQGESNKTGVEIAVSGVTLDLNGFELDGAVRAGGGPSRFGVAVTGSNNRNITIRNGSVRNWGLTGVNASTAESVRIANVQSSDNDGTGIFAGGGLVRDCTAVANGFTGINLASGRVVDCVAVGNAQNGFALAGAVASGCVARDNSGNGFSMAADCVVSGSLAIDNSSDGFNALSGAHISGCVARNNDSEGFQLSEDSVIRECVAASNGGHGIVADGDSLIAANVSNGNTLDGVRSNGGRNRIEGNQVAENVFGGITAAGFDALIVRNVAGENGAQPGDTNYAGLNNDAPGPIVTSPAGADPWANFAINLVR